MADKCHGRSKRSGLLVKTGPIRDRYECEIDYENTFAA